VTSLVLFYFLIQVCIFIIQVILSPFDSVADTYRALLPEGTPMEFQRILELKVESILVVLYMV
jgi:hypothetical protein